ncbi:helix-turn-helix transcriptional regulator [Palleronia marisminoris]|nr:response regulator transcription factor [Palleronia marisminoris]
MYFSDALLAAVAKELSDCYIYRSDDLDDGSGAGTKVVLASLDSVTDLAAFLDDTAMRCPKAHVAFIYDNEVVARSFFAAHGDTILREGISLIPMNVRLDVWLLFIRLFLLGQTYLSRELMVASEDAAKEEQLKVAAKIVGRLTQREIEILALAARGAQNKVIAERLGISEHTVKLHMHHVIRKMNVQNRTEAAHLFLQTVGSGSGEPVRLRGLGDSARIGYVPGKP